MTIPDATEAFMQWRPLLMKICGEYARNYRWLHDDFVSDAHLALWKDFTKPTRAAGEPAGPLIATIVKRAIWERLKRERAACRHFDPDQHADTLGLVPARDPGDVARIDIEDSLDVLLNNLRINVLDRLNGITYAEIAQKRGTTYQAAQQRISRAIGKLAESLLS